MKKHFNKVIAGILTAAMIVPATASLAEPLSTSAYEVLGESTFNYKMLPWSVVTQSPAKQDFFIDDGTVHIRILQPEGKDREKWDLQFRHRNLSFKAGHEYKVSFKVKSHRAGMELTSFIGTLNEQEEYFVLDGRDDELMHMGPHMGGQWAAGALKLTTDWQTVEGIFTPTEDLDSVQWTFQYAKGTKYAGNAQSGDELWFDDMSIEDLTDPDGPGTYWYLGYTTRGNSGLENNYISVNQLGYYPKLEKIAVLGDNKGDVTYGAPVIDLDGEYTYEIVKTSDDKVAFTGRTSAAEKDSDSGDKVCKIDFTTFDTPGEYYIRIKDKEWRSFPFKIGDDIYSNSENNMLTNALNYFYQNRSGMDISEKYITSGVQRELAHSYNRDEGTGFVQTHWDNKSYFELTDIEKYGSSSIDVSGGWFDGSTYNKSMVSGGMSAWMLQNIYERAAQTKEGKEKFADGSGTVVIPESGNKYPDILDECRYELDFMSKMKVPSGEKTWGKYAGMYYHSAIGIGFDENRLDYEHDYHSAYAVMPPSFAATLNYAACAAQGARLWAEYDADYANELMKSAKEAFEAYDKNWYAAAPGEYANEKSLYASKYLSVDGDDEVSDDAYWAACELFISAKALNDSDADKYYKVLSDYKNAFQFSDVITGGDNIVDRGSYTLFNTGNTAAAGSMSLLLHKDMLPDEKSEMLSDSLADCVRSYIDIEDKQGYAVPYRYNQSEYYDPIGSPTIEYDGFEFNSNERIINNMIGMAYAYDINDNNDCINRIATGMNYLFGNNPLSYSYVTGYGSYRVKNPVHRYWQREIDKTLPAAPDGVLVSGATGNLYDNYIRALGYTNIRSGNPTERYYADSVEAYASNDSLLTTNAALAWIVSFMQDEATDAEPKEALMGDVDNNGNVNIADFVVFQKWLLGYPNTKLANWKAADFSHDGALDIFDLALMKDHFIAVTNMDYIKPDEEIEYGSPVYVLKDGLKLYLGPDECYKSVASLPRDARLKELGFNKNISSWFFTEYNGQYGWIKIYDENTNSETVYYEQSAAKPVIYLYPEEETDVHVDLELTESELSTTYPKYNNGWDVTAYPDGKLLNKADGTHHKYLFWDSKNGRTRYDFSKGFCIAGSDTESFLREKLTYMGLTEDEMNEFIVYWLPIMEHNKYNLITFQGDAYTNSAKLNITPTPDSILRVFMAFVPLEEEADIQPQQLETFERKGFTVVEWGGSEIKG